MDESQQTPTDDQNSSTYSSYNITPSGTIELKTIGKHSDSNKEAFWVEDTEVDHCFGCQNYFRVHTRKHHCRLCGYIFCSNCSNNKTPIVNRNYLQPVRTCNDCFNIICLRSLSHSPSLKTLSHSAEGIERIVRKRINSIQVITYAIPPLYKLGSAKSITTLLYVASAVQQISADTEYHSFLVDHERGRELGLKLSAKEEENEEKKSKLEDKFRCCRKQLFLSCRALLMLASTTKYKQLIAGNGRLKFLLDMALSQEVTFTQSIHDLLLSCTLELSMDDLVCQTLFGMDHGLDLVIAIIATNDNDSLQIIALEVLLKLAQTKDDYRAAIVSKAGALETLCNLLSNSAKGPQRTTSMQLVAELAKEDAAKEKLLTEFSIVVPLLEYLLKKEGLKAKNCDLIANTIGLLGFTSTFRDCITKSLLSILDSLPSTMTKEENERAQRGIQYLLKQEWLGTVLQENSCVANIMKSE